MLILSNFISSLILLFGLKAAAIFETNGYPAFCSSLKQNITGTDVQSQYDKFVKDFSSSCVEKSIKDTCKLARPILAANQHTLWQNLCKATVPTIRACPGVAALALIGVAGFNSLRCDIK